MSTVPIIDVAPLLDGSGTSEVAGALDHACRDTGFFCVTGHGVPVELSDELDRSARALFARSPAEKATIAMATGGRAWRGWFPLGGEVTGGVPDRKEGIYFGQERCDDDPLVRAGTALHGANRFPSEVPSLGPLVLEWIDRLTALGHQLMSAIALGLGLPGDWFRTHLTADPTVLFRIFRYPPTDPAADHAAGVTTGEWGVAEHTDYGLLTLLLQDDCGGLQVRGRDGWIDVPPVPGAFVCNIGDMLERITGGRYRSTPHRVRNTSGRERLSFPLFFDPSWDATIEPLPLAAGNEPDAATVDRWDGRSVFDFDGTYGEYLTAKVARVFPDLFRTIA